jgi:hypothetical protein
MLERELTAMTAERNALRGECERVKGERNAIGVRIRGEWMGKADALAKERDTAQADLASLRLKMLHDTAALIRERDGFKIAFETASKIARDHETEITAMRAALNEAADVAEERSISLGGLNSLGAARWLDRADRWRKARGAA